MTQVLNLRHDPYLSGNYAPVADELDAGPLPVTGELPAALDGMFVRNGPNPMFEPVGRYHIFDGDGMLHAVTLREGRASYRNRWVRTPGLEAERRAGRALYGGMANATAAPAELVGDAGPFKNAANTSVIRHAGRIMCLWEAGFPTVVTPELETVGVFDYDGALVGAMTAHPKIDPETGELLFFGYSAIPPYLRYYVASADGTITRRVDIDLPAPVMIHDFVTTRDHVVFLDAPAVFDFKSFAAGGPMLRWLPDNGTRIGVMARDGDASDILWCDVDPCYVFHFMNACSLGSTVRIEASRLDRMDIGLDTEPESEIPAAQSCLARFEVDLDARTARWEPLDDLRGDFPRINDGYSGLPYRYGYKAVYLRPESGGAAFDGIARYDFERGATAMVCDFGSGKTGEPVFAPDPAGRDEDDGWLLSYVYEPERDATDLCVVDARDPAAGPIARVHLPRRVPYGFHGNWLPRI